MSSKYGEDEKKISLNVAMRMPYTGRTEGHRRQGINPQREQGPMAIQVFPTYVNGKCTMVMTGMWRSLVNEDWICQNSYKMRRPGISGLRIPMQSNGKAG